MQDVHARSRQISFLCNLVENDLSHGKVSIQREKIKSLSLNIKFGNRSHFLVTGVHSSPHDFFKMMLCIKKHFSFSSEKTIKILATNKNFIVLDNTGNTYSCKSRRFKPFDQKKLVIRSTLNHFQRKIMMKQMKQCGPSFLEIRLKKLACFVDIADDELKEDDEVEKEELVETDAIGNPIRKLQPTYKIKAPDSNDDSGNEEEGEEFLLLLPRNKKGKKRRKAKTTKTVHYRRNLNVRSMYNSYIHAVSSTCPRKIHLLLPMKKLLIHMIKNNKRKNKNMALLAKDRQIQLLSATGAATDNDSVDIIDDLIRAESSKNVVTGGGVEVKASRAVVLRTNSNLAVEIDNNNGGALHGEDTDTTTMADSLPPSPPRLTSSPPPLMDLEQPVSIKALVGPPPPPPSNPPSSRPPSEQNDEDDDLFSLEEDIVVDPSATKKEMQLVKEEEIATPKGLSSSETASPSSQLTNAAVEIASLDLLKQQQQNGNNTIHMTNGDGKQIVVAVRDDHERIVSDGNPPTFAEFNMDVEVEILQTKKLLFPSEDDSATNEMTISSGSSLSTASSLSNPSDENDENFSIPSTPSDENESTNSLRDVNKSIKKDWVVEAKDEDKQNRAWLKYLKSKKIKLDNEDTVTKKKRSRSAAIAKLIVPKKIRTYYKSMKWFAGEVVKEIYKEDDLCSSSSSSSNDDGDLFGVSSDDNEYQQEQKKNQETLGKPIMMTSSCSKKHVELLLNPDDENEDPTLKESEGPSEVVQISDTPLIGLSDDSTFEDVYYDAEEDSDHEEDAINIAKSQPQLLPPMSICCTCPQDPCDTLASTNDIIENTLSYIQEEMDIPPSPIQTNTFTRGSRTYNSFKYPLDEIAEDTVVEVGIGEDEFVYDEELLMQLIVPKADVRSRSTTTITRETVTT